VLTYFSDDKAIVLNRTFADCHMSAWLNVTVFNNVSVSALNATFITEKKVLNFHVKPIQPFNYGDTALLVYAMDDGCLVNLQSWLDGRPTNVLPPFIAFGLNYTGKIREQSSVRMLVARYMRRY